MRAHMRWIVALPGLGLFVTPVWARRSGETRSDASVIASSGRDGVLSLALVPDPSEVEPPPVKRAPSASALSKPKDAQRE